MEIRQDTVFLSGRGNLTLPASIRRALGLKGKQQMLVEANDNGEIVLRPAVTLPIEYYTEERIAEFAEDDEELGKILDRLDKRKSPRKPPRKPRR